MVGWNLHEGYGYFLGWKRHKQKYKFFNKKRIHSCKKTRKCIDRINTIIPQFSNMVTEENTHSGKYYIDRKIIAVPIVKIMEKELTVGDYNIIPNLLKKKFSFWNKDILIYFTLLHEYRHSKQSRFTYDFEKSLISKLPDNKFRSLLYRYLPSEFDADRWALKFIKKHWDFLIKHKVN
jgi:hypothetical protein